MEACEANFDGLVGPTHNYAGLAYGNVSAMEHAFNVSNPRAAVLEGLRKMKLVADLGVKQAVLPPQERPRMDVLRRLGFTGRDPEVLNKAFGQAPVVLAACFSASSMWAANVATVSPSADSADGLVHFTPANMLSNFHRSMEAEFTGRILKAIFSDEACFFHHEPLPASLQFADEGAANHTRLCRSHAEQGIEVFAYGRRAFEQGDSGPRIYPGRQTIEASQAIARLHRLEPSRTVFVRQNPAAIDAGVFHNDVISVGNENVLLYHSQAFASCEHVIDNLKRRFVDFCGSSLHPIEVTQEDLSVSEAVASYLFNSQLVTLPDRTMCLITPAECREIERARLLLERLKAGSNPVSQVRFVDVRQSMKNGGGPACLRLRVVLTKQEMAKAHQGVFFTDKLHADLTAWANRYYRDRLHPDDLADPALPEEVRVALDNLTQILGLGSIYDFQRQGSGR